MRRSFLICVGLLIAVPLAPAQETSEPLPERAVARIGTTRYHASKYHSAYLVAPNGKLLAINMPGEGIALRNLPDWTRARLIHVDSIDPDTRARFDALAFTPDSKKLILFNGNTEQLLIYDLTSGKVVRRITVPGDGPFYDPMLSAVDDQKTFVFGWDEAITWQQIFVICDLEKGEIKRTCKIGVERDLVQQFAISPDGRRVVHQQSPPPLLVQGNINKSILEVWDLASGKSTRSIKISAPMKTMAFSPDSKTLIAFGDDASLRKFNLETGQEERIRTAGKPHEPLLFSPDGLSFFVGLPNGSIAHHKLADSSVVATYPSPVACPTSRLAMQGSGKVLGISISRSTAFLWDMRSGKLLTPTDVPIGAVDRLGFSPRGELFVTAENGHVAWWDARQAIKLRDAKRSDKDTPRSLTNEVRYSRDGRWVARKAEASLVLSRIETRSAKAETELGVRNHDLTRFTFAPDSRALAYAVVDPLASPPASTILIVELASKEVRLELPPLPSGEIGHLAYHPDSGLLASAADDGMIHVWQVGLAAYVGKPDRKPDAEAVDAWFRDMNGPDARAAFQGMIELARTPDAIKLFADRIPPAPKPSGEIRTIAQWIGDLGSKHYPVRTKAEAMLQRIGFAAEPELRAALTKAPDLERKRRIELLLERIAVAEPSPQDIRNSRAVEVIEAVATPEARGLLKRWSDGDPMATLTSEARQALARLTKATEKSGADKEQTFQETPP